MRKVRKHHIGVALLLVAGAATIGGLALGATGGTPSALVPIAPCRLVDTRPAPLTVGTRNTPVGSGQTVTFKVLGSYGDCTIPPDATGIATNVTAVNPTAPSYLTVFPSGGTKPNASNLNWTATSPPTPNQVTVGVGDGGAIDVYNLTGSIDVIIDVVGYYVPESGGGSSGSIGATGPTGATGADGAPRNCSATPYRGINLASCDFLFADLAGANISQAFMPGVSFTGADLSNAFVRSSYMPNAEFSSATLDGADLENISAPSISGGSVHAVGTDLSGATLDRGSLTDAVFTNATFTAASLRFVDLSRSDLTGAHFDGADVTAVRFNGATCPDGTTAASHGQSCSGHFGAGVVVYDPVPV